MINQSAYGARGTKHFEGCLKPVKGRPGYYTTYYCPAGVLTIGYGHTNAQGRRFVEGEVWSQAEVDRAYEEDMNICEAGAQKLISVPLT